MSIRVSIEVVPHGAGDGPFVAGMAVVRVNGTVLAKLRTSEAYEVFVPDPTFESRNYRIEGERADG